jgi:hypothetical protein
MRIFEVKLLGKQRSDGLPKCLVRITRAFACNTITLNIIDPKGVREYNFPVNTPENIRSVAAYLQRELDGCKAADSEIQEYCRLLERLENLS